MQPDEYHKMAEVEDRMWYYRTLHRHIVNSVRPRSRGLPLRLLDAGCGTGGLMRRLKEAYPEWQITGLDFSPLACELATACTGGEVVQGSVTNLPFPDATFDIIVSCDVVCQVSDPVRAVSEFHRCLKRGGVLVLTMPAYQWMYSYHDREVANLRRYSRTEVSELLARGRFGIVSSTYWNMLPFPVAFIRRKMLPPPASGSDVKTYPAAVEAGFSFLMTLELGWLWGGGRMPFGNSVLTVARKSSHDAVPTTP